MINTILKTAFTKLSPKKIIYRDYKNCPQLHFEEDLENNLAPAHPSTYRNFESIIMKTLEENAPTKTKVIRGNNNPHINETLRRAIMKRLTSKKIANKTKREDIRNYKDQRSLAVKLCIQSKRHHFRMMQSKRIENDKEFCKTILYSPYSLTRFPLARRLY